ncbi:hypothetical protein Bca101_080742 [Brassica carinata]
MASQNCQEITSGRFCGDEAEARARRINTWKEKDRRGFTAFRQEAKDDELSMYGIIWDEIGEGYNERDKMLLELEQECTTRKLRKLASTYLSCKDP